MTLRPARWRCATRPFAPSEVEVEEAPDVLAAWEAGAGAEVVTRGRTLENLHVETAQWVLETASAIEALTAEAAQRAGTAVGRTRPGLSADARLVGHDSAPAVPARP